MINIEQIFKSFDIPGAYNLLDSNHPLDFYIGLDDKGRKSLVLRGDIKPDIVKSTSAIDISVGQIKNNIWSLGFHLNQNSMSGLFYRFCDDLIESSRDIPNNTNGMVFVERRYNSWKKMFFSMKKDILSENEIMGLVGELLFLKKKMLRLYSETVAINSWSGYNKTHKDFSVDDTWFEIKTTKSSSLTIRIHSIEQLDADIDGHLVVFELEKMSESFDGYTLNSIIREILNNLAPENVDLLLDKLKNAGWEYNDAYDQFVYRITNQEQYLVNSSFPRIHKNGISPSIVKVEYDLLKKDLIMFKEVF